MAIDRRKMLRLIGSTALGLGLAALGSVAGLWAAAVARFMSPNVRNQPTSIFPAGVPADYAEGQVETKYRQAYGVWIVRAAHRGRSRICALRAACTHLGCITVWRESEQKFQCPCHGSGFSREGINIEGPAARALERCAIRLADDGRLEVDGSRTFQQQLGEWNDPRSYVDA